MTMIIYLMEVWFVLDGPYPMAQSFNAGHADIGCTAVAAVLSKAEWRFAIPATEPNLLFANNIWRPQAYGHSTGYCWLLYNVTDAM